MYKMVKKIAVLTAVFSLFFLSFNIKSHNQLTTQDYVSKYDGCYTSHWGEAEKDLPQKKYLYHKNEEMFYLLDVTYKPFSKFDFPHNIIIGYEKGKLKQARYLYADKSISEEIAKQITKDLKNYPSENENVKTWRNGKVEIQERIGDFLEIIIKSRR